LPRDFLGSITPKGSGLDHHSYRLSTRLLFDISYSATLLVGLAFDTLSPVVAFWLCTLFVFPLFACVWLGSSDLLRGVLLLF
jgi:hypothetical protein